MTGTGTHPAVFAGLLGATWASMPTVALAQPLDDVVEAVSGSLLLQFVVGCAMGAAVAGVVSAIASRLAHDDDEILSTEEEDDFWRNSSLNMVQAQEEVGEHDPTGDLGRFRTGQITIDLPALADEAVAAAITGPRHFAPTPARRQERRAARRSGRHFAGAEAGQAKAPQASSARAPRHGAHSVQAAKQEPAAAPTRGRHFATALAREAAPAAVTAAPAAEMAPAVAAEKAPAPVELNPRARLAALPVIESRHVPVREPQKVRRTVDTMGFVPLGSVTPTAAPASTGHSKATQSAADEQHKPGLTGRLRMQVAVRAEGVRAVLAERLGAHVLDDVPLIERADGSTATVTPTWFDQTLAPALASITGITNRLDDTTPRMADEPARQRVATDAPSRAAYITDRVAEVNVGVFPERRSAEELEQGDAWEQALEAMGEALEQVAPPVFQDVVGGPSTIDDPDGLEGPTGFIPFRVPAAHPEVVDTDTYVDYLLRDEISQNGSAVLRRSPHAHLRVIEGGTGRLRTRRKADETDAPVRGRHFAQPLAYAAEA